MAGLAVTEFLIFLSFFFFNSTMYEEGNKAKLKREFFSNTAAEEFAISLVRWRSLVKSV